MTRTPARRRGGPYLTVIDDLLRHAIRTRSWLPFLVVLVAALAAALAVLGQAALPYAIYPAL